MKPTVKDIKQLIAIDIEKLIQRSHRGAVEENVKLKLVVPLLNLLGYDTVKDLDFEHRVRSKAADIAIELDGRPRVSIECKDLKEKLDSHLEQAFTYACWKGFLLLGLTNGKEIRVYKTWEASSDLEDRRLFRSTLKDLPKTFFEKKGLWDLLCRENVLRQSTMVDRWKEAQAKLPMMTAYINGLLDDVAIKEDKEKILTQAYEFLASYEHSKAIERFRLCLTLEDLKKSEMLALHIQIGNAFYDQGKLVEAHGVFKEGLEIAVAVEDQIGRSACLGNIGLIYSDKGDLDEALKYLKQALEIFEAHGYVREVEQIKRNIAAIERMKNE